MNTLTVQTRYSRFSFLNPYKYSTPMAAKRSYSKINLWDTPLVLEFLDDTLVRITLPGDDCPSDTAHTDISKRWEHALTLYLEGKLLTNELPEWSLQASAFQTQVLQYLLEATTPGQVLTYQQLALTLFDSANYTRAVARSLASNPLPLIFPCHRVMGSGQVWKGYALGQELWLKLITLENQQSTPVKA